MTEDKPRILERDWVYIVLMAVIVIGFCNRLLFTDMIIRASDVITQFIWGAKAMKQQPLWDYLSHLPTLFRADWEPLQDGGRTLEGGWNALGLLVHRFLIMHYFPFPSSIAWLAVLSLLWGGIGTFLYCRTIGVGRCGALAAGLLYALCTENASLINAGHIQKIEAISWAPWAIYFLEKSLRSGRFFNYAMTALMLAIQFFTMHWQIAFYTCLAVGAYWIFLRGGAVCRRCWRLLEAVRQRPAAGNHHTDPVLQHRCHVIRSALELVEAVRARRGDVSGGWLELVHATGRTAELRNSRNGRVFPSGGGRCP